MNVTDFVIDAKATFGERMIAIEERATFEYVDNKRTNNRDGTRYTLVLLDRGYAQISVKFPGVQPVHVEKGTPVPVFVDGLTVNWYTFDGKLKFTLSANEIHKADEE